MQIFENPLRDYFENNLHNKLVWKWIHYFDIYHDYLQEYRNKSNFKILEIGVYKGGSLEMWRHYFGAEAKIYGIDISPECKSLESQNIEIFIGDVCDRKFLQETMAKIGSVDVVIDDGGHTMQQQIIAFEEIYPFVTTSGGIYICEDVHTSYYEYYGGGYKKPGTFIEYAKQCIDKLHAWHSFDRHQIAVDEFTKTTNSISFYDSMVIFCKSIRERPYDKQVGGLEDAQEEDEHIINLRKVLEEKEALIKQLTYQV